MVERGGSGIKGNARGRELKGGNLIEVCHVGSSLGGSLGNLASRL